MGGIYEKRRAIDDARSVQAEFGNALAWETVDDIEVFGVVNGVPVHVLMYIERVSNYEIGCICVLVDGEYLREVFPSVARCIELIKEWCGDKDNTE